MPAPANLVHETTTGTGAANLTVTAVNGKRRFSTAFGTGATTNVFDYFISNRDAAEWERGTGHMSDANTLVRDTVIESSNANALVSFSAGTKDVANDIPAANQARLDATQSWTGSNTFPNTGLKVQDTNGTHPLVLKNNSDLTAERTLSIQPGDADRTIILAGNTTLSGTNTGDQTLPVAATQAELEAASILTAFTTPGRQHFHPSAVKAWVNFNGAGTPAVTVGYNVSSITDNGTGDWTVNWTTPFSTANYCSVTAQSTTNAAVGTITVQDRNPAGSFVAPTAGAQRFNAYNLTGFSQIDIERVNVAVLGDHA
jgi:hypothetical protein